MASYRNIIIWWCTFAVLWSFFRFFDNPEWLTELVAKPIIWLGVAGLSLQLGVIPRAVVSDLQTQYMHVKPVWKTLLLPVLFIIFYFFIINFKLIVIPVFSISSLLSALMINFSTGIVEEIVFRGILYVWLLQKTNKIAAFIIVQILFLLIHLPMLVFKSSSLSTALTHAFFIVLMGSLFTLIFRITKSLPASIFAHGTWNTLVFYFLLV